MTKKVNQVLFDLSLGHNVDLAQFSNGTVARMIGLLNRSDKEIMASIAAALEKASSNLTVSRLDKLLGTAREKNQEAYLELRQRFALDLREFVDTEANFHYNLLNKALPKAVVVELGVSSVSASQVYTTAMAQPFRGRLLREWFDGLEENRAQRIKDAIRIGYLTQEPAANIIKAIRGTKAANYSDGLMEKDRHHLAAVVNTSLSHFAAVTRDRFFEENRSIIKHVQWVAVLDSRTSAQCRIRDSKLYTNDAKHTPVGHKYPWELGPGRLHFCCRSTAIPAINSLSALGLGSMPEGTRAAMDGEVPESTTYATWLKKQSVDRQDEVLGPTRGILFRKGGLELKDFHNAFGKWLTLAELAKRDAAAFKRAGL